MGSLDTISIARHPTFEVLDQRLKDLLIGIGVDPADYGDPHDAWWRLRREYAHRVNLIDLYDLVAHPRGLEAHQLSVAERDELTAFALPLMDEGFEIIAGSGRPERDAVELVPYDPSWPRLYAGWRTRLAKTLGAVARRIEHVGSTAVPGLAAKPIIDIQVSVDDVQDEAGYVLGIEGLGVQFRNRDPQHRFFRPFSGRPRSVHIHVCGAGSEWERRHLLFRDYLRASASAREVYVAAKLAAAERWRDDRVAYTEAKDAQIRELMEAAETWARNRSGQA